MCLSMSNGVLYARWFTKSFLQVSVYGMSKEVMRVGEGDERLDKVWVEEEILAKPHNMYIHL